jgi:rhamnosyltransferase
MEKISEATVLMATYNGEKWLESQLQSILKQKNVKIKLAIQDDNSEDDTQKIIKKFQKKNKIDLKINKKNQRSASLNFLNLIIKTNTKSDYYAFSDQDDIWYSNKLSRGIKKLDENKCEAYSSNVSIISNKKKLLMNKSSNQKKYDFIFEGVPGCTIVLTKNSFLQIKKKLIKLNSTELKKISMHDSFIYFYLRSRKVAWYIDKYSYINYRQHENNVVGLNYGLGFSEQKLNSFKKRFKMIRNSFYIISILNLAKISNFENWVIKSLERLNFIDRIKLIINVSIFRRRTLDCFFLILILLIIK